MNTQQNHFGSGNNIQNFINNEVDIKAFSDNIKNILKTLLHRNFDAALTELTSLEKIQNVSDKLKKTLSIIKILIHLTKGDHNYTGFLNEINDFLNIISNENPENPLELDIAHTTNILYFIRTSEYEAAQNLFKSINNPDLYTTCIYYEHLANNSELDRFSKDKDGPITEEKLCAIIRGYIRLEKYSAAVKASHQLFKHYDNPNSFFLLIFSEISDTLTDKNIYYWCLTYTQKNELLKKTDELINQILTTKEPTNRVLDLASQLLTFFIYDHDDLRDVCWKYIHYYENSDKGFSVYLRSFYEKKSTSTNDYTGKILSDIEYTEKNAAKLISKESLSPEECITLSLCADSTTINEWITQNGNIKCKNKNLKHYCLLYLHCSTDPYSSDQFSILQSRLRTY